MIRTLFMTIVMSAFAAMPLSAQEAPAKKAAPKKAVAKVPTHEISGRVFDAATHEPASGVQVRVYNESRYFITYDAFASNRIPDIYVTERGQRER